MFNLDRDKVQEMPSNPFFVKSSRIARESSASNQNRPKQIQMEDIESVAENSNNGDGEQGPEAIHPVSDDLDARNQNQEEQGICLPTELMPYPSYLHTHIGIMHNLGLIPLKANGDGGSGLHMILFMFISATSLIYTSGKNVVHFKEFARKGNLDDYAEGWFYISELCLKVYYFNLVAMHRPCISSILRNTKRTLPGICVQSSTKVAKVAVVTGLLSVAWTLAWAIRLDLMLLNGFTASDILVSRSFRTSKFLLLWKNYDRNDTSYVDELRAEFGQVGTKATGMGVFGIICHFIGRLQHHFIRDTLFMSALHINKLSKGLRLSILQLTNSEGRGNDEVVVMLKRQHKTMFGEAMLVNNVFGNFFKLVHLNDWFYCSYFALDLMYGDVTNIFFVEAIIVIPKIIGAFILSTHAINTVHDLKDIIEDKYCEMDKDGKEYRRFSPFFKKIKHNPIGIGSGYFLLNEGFATNFIGLVISCFIIFATYDSTK